MGRIIIVSISIWLLLVAAYFLTRNGDDSGMECYPGQGKIGGIYQC